MKEKIKVIGFAGLLVGAIIALSALVSECHDVRENAKEVNEECARIQAIVDEMKKCSLN